MRPALYLLFLLSGATALVYQVVWVRQQGLVFGGTHLAVSTVLAVFMGGLAPRGLAHRPPCRSLAAAAAGLRTARTGHCPVCPCRLRHAAGVPGHLCDPGRPVPGRPHRPHPTPFPPGHRRDDRADHVDGRHAAGTVALRARGRRRPGRAPVAPLRPQYPGRGGRGRRDRLPAPAATGHLAHAPCRRAREHHGRRGGAASRAARVGGDAGRRSGGSGAGRRDRGDSRREARAGWHRHQRLLRPRLRGAVDTRPRHHSGHVDLCLHRDARGVPVGHRPGQRVVRPVHATPLCRPRHEESRTAVRGGAGPDRLRRPRRHLAAGRPVRPLGVADQRAGRGGLGRVRGAAGDRFRGSLLVHGPACIPDGCGVPAGRHRPCVDARAIFRRRGRGARLEHRGRHPRSARCGLHPDQGVGHRTLAGRVVGPERGTGRGRHRRGIRATRIASRRPGHCGRNSRRAGGPARRRAPVEPGSHGDLPQQPARGVRLARGGAGRPRQHRHPLLPRGRQLHDQRHPRQGRRPGGTGQRQGRRFEHGRGRAVPVPAGAPADAAASRPEAGLRTGTRHRHDAGRRFTPSGGRAHRPGGARTGRGAGGTHVCRMEPPRTG
jgi:hypothetical protein